MFEYMLVFVLVFVLVAIFTKKDESRKTVPDNVREELYYVRGILRKRFDGQINDLRAMELLVAAYHRGVKVEIMMAYAKIAKSWDAWAKDMSEVTPALTEYEDGKIPGTARSIVLFGTVVGVFSNEDD